MAQIKSTDIVQEKIFADFRKDANATLIVLEELEKLFLETSESATKLADSIEKKGSKNLSDIAKAIDEANKASEAYNETREEKIKLQKQIADLEIKEQKAAQQAIKTQKDKITLQQKEISLQKTKKKNIELTAEEIKQNEQLKRANKERNETLKATAILEDKEAGILEKLAAKNKLLRIERAKLSDETKEGRAEIKRINKEINKNTDRIKDNVDEFTKDKIAVGGYTKALNSSLKKIGLMTAGLLGLNSALSSVGSSLNANEESSQELEVLTDQLAGTYDVLKNATGSAALSLFNYTKGLFSAEDQTKSFSDVLDEIVGSYDNIGDKIKKNNEVTEEATRQNQAFRKVSRGLREELVKINGELEQQNLIAGDTTRGFNEQAEAAQKAAQLVIEKASIENDLATAQIEIVNKQIASLAGLEEATVKSSTAAELSAKSTANINTLLDQRTELTIQLQESENELNTATLDNAKIQREIQRDRFERELDFAIDAFDAVKTINERKFASEKTTEEERAALIEKTNRLAQSSFDEQIKLVEDFTKQRLNLNELVLENDEKVIRERLKQYDLDDVTLGRVLEIIRERKTVTQDIIDLEVDLTEQVKERTKTEIEAANELAELRQQVKVNLAQEEFDRAKSNEALIKLRDEQIEAEKLSRSNQLEVVEDNADKRAKIIEESEEKIRQIKAKSLEAQNKLEEEANKKAIAERQEMTEAAFKVLSQVISQNSQARIDAIDREVSATQQRQEEIQASAEAGSLERQESLAFEQKKQAELELQREQEIEQQKKVELGLLALEIYSSKVAAGDPNPLGSTALAIEALKALAGSIPTFYEGTKGGTIAEALGNPDLSNTKDGYIVRVDGSEAVLNPHETKEYHQFLKNQDVKEKPANNIIYNDTETQQKLTKLIDVINSRPTYVGGDFDQQQKVFTQTINEKNKIIKKHYKTGGLFN